MTPKQLKEWIFRNSLADQWWVSTDAVTCHSPETVKDIEDKLKCGKYPQIKVLHISQLNLTPPPWIEVELAAPMEPPRGSAALIHPRWRHLPQNVRNRTIPNIPPGQVQCLHCRSIIAPQPMAASCTSTFIMVLLLCAGIIPGLIYIAWDNGRKQCPNCKFAIK